MVRWWIVVLVVILAGAAQAAAPETPWLPSESWPGGTQYDPRLEQPVRLWGAGMPVAKALEQLSSQTEVALSVWPAGDLNERICISAFLDPQSPPTLREVLVQVAWVIDTSVSVSGGGDGRHYHILSSGQGARRDLDQIEAQWIEEEQRRGKEAVAAAGPQLFARLRDLAPYLGMSREAAIAEFRGKDDLFLLDLLDPKRQAAARFLGSLSPEDVAETQRQVTFARKLSSFSPEQRALLRQGLQLEKWTQWQAHRPTPDVHWEDWAWVEQADPEVRIGIGATDGFQVNLAIKAEGERFPKPGYGLDLPFLPLLPDPQLEGQPDPGLALAVRRALGETVTPEEEQKAYEEANRLRGLHARRQLLPAQSGWRPVLSAETEKQLGALRLDLRPEEPYALWQVQELVAARTGRHVISDCYTQDPRLLKEGVEVAYPGRESALTALMALKILAIEKATEEGVVPWGLYGWEWGDAGRFLRFRQAARQPQRAAFLSAEVVAATAGWVDPYLPAEAELAKLPPLDVPLDPKGVVWLSNHLTPAQRYAGLYLVYGDPTDPKEAYRRHLRAQLAEVLGQCAGPYQLLGTLSRKQWERAQRSGLVWGEDITAQPTELESNSGWWRDRKRGDVLRIAAPDEDLAKLAEERLGTRDLLLVEVRREGRLIADPVPLFRRLHLAPQVRPHLTR